MKYTVQLASSGLKFIVKFNKNVSKATDKIVSGESLLKTIGGVLIKMCASKCQKMVRHTKMYLLVKDGII